MKIVYNFILLFGIFLPLISGRHVPFYRKDYTYVEDYNAFYKLHWDMHILTWNDAFLECDNEGASLFYPRVKSEWSLVKPLMDDLKETPNVTDIFIGVHDKFGIGEFITVDGHPTPSSVFIEEPKKDFKLPNTCVLMHIETGSYKIGDCANDTPLPFVCKKVETKLCPTIDTEYKYVQSSRKCYKINRRERSWDEAMRTCYMEGGILTVLQNQDEANALRPILDDSSLYHAGFHRTSPSNEFYTVTGRKFNEVYHTDRDEVYQRDRVQGYILQVYNDNDSINEGIKECGSVTTTSRSFYTSINDCNIKLPFICEMQSNL